MPSTALSIAEIRAAIFKLGGRFLDALKPFLPSQVRFNGRIYRRAAIQTPEQFGWYIAALGMVSPESVRNALAAMQKSSNYDAEAEYCDCHKKQRSYDDSVTAYGIDPVTIGIIVSIVAAILKQAPGIISSLQAPPSEPAGSGGHPDSESGGKKDDMNTTLLILLAVLLLAGDK